VESSSAVYVFSGVVSSFVNYTKNRSLVKMVEFYDKNIDEKLMSRTYLSNGVLSDDLDTKRVLTWDHLSVWSNHIILDVGGFYLRVHLINE